MQSRMAATDPAERDPVAKAELRPFEEADFHALAPGLNRDRQYDDRRLATRRKLLSLGKVFAARAEAAGLQLEVRSSLHTPSSFNHNQVKRLWCYASRGKAEKRRLKGVLGADLAKDLDAAYRNAYLCCAIEHDALEVSLRIHADAWFDGQNLASRVKREGTDGWKARLNELDGFRLRLHDWKGEWRCGSLIPEQLEEFLKYYKPAEHLLTVERRWPAPPGARAALFAPEVPGLLVEELLRLVPLYRFSAWSAESDHLFTR
ncbi:MAG: hypothetical protein JNK02_18110 [Planctomycetes bacterium]|nr:hypothetical protein [Planctomycetota bacterium]